MGQIFSQARSNNKGQHITGALLVSGDWFAQVLEGDEAMARVSEDGESDIPLIAHVDGISPAAGHRVTPEQDSVLGSCARRPRRPARSSDRSAFAVGRDIDFVIFLWE